MTTRLLVLSRSHLVERAASLASSEEVQPACLPAFAVVQGIAERCGLLGEVLGRADPSYMGLLAALFHNREKGFKIMNNFPSKKM